MPRRSRPSVIWAWAFFLDSFKFTSCSFGWISEWIGGRGRGMWEATLMRVNIVPFRARIVVLVFKAEKRWASWFTGLGFVVIVIEILNRV